MIARKKGMNPLERGSQVQDRSEFQELLDFPPAPKLTVFGLLDESRAGEAERRRQEIFFGKGKCGTCHIPPYCTDNLMHNLQVERFYTARMINGRAAAADGPIKTFPLRGIKESPPYFHDGRLLTLSVIPLWCRRPACPSGQPGRAHAHPASGIRLARFLPRTGLLCTSVGCGSLG